MAILFIPASLTGIKEIFFFFGENVHSIYSTIHVRSPQISTKRKYKLKNYPVNYF